MRLFLFFLISIILCSCRAKPLTVIEELKQLTDSLALNSESGFEFHHTQDAQAHLRIELQRHNLLVLVADESDYEGSIQFITRFLKNASPNFLILDLDMRKQWSLDVYTDGPEEGLLIEAVLRDWHMDYHRRLLDSIMSPSSRLLDALAVKYGLDSSHYDELKGSIQDPYSPYFAEAYKVFASISDIQQPPDSYIRSRRVSSIVDSLKDSTDKWTLARQSRSTLQQYLSLSFYIDRPNDFEESIAYDLLPYLRSRDMPVYACKIPLPVLRINKHIDNYYHSIEPQKAFCQYFAVRQSDSILSQEIFAARAFWSGAYQLNSLLNGLLNSEQAKKIDAKGVLILRDRDLIITHKEELQFENTKGLLAELWLKDFRHSISVNYLLSAETHGHEEYGAISFHPNAATHIIY